MYRRGNTSRKRFDRSQLNRWPLTPSGRLRQIPFTKALTWSLKVTWNLVNTSACMSLTGEWSNGGPADGRNRARNLLRRVPEENA